ncbi:RNA polymerase sigma factor [Desertivirga xinjiangensis]|uniref:RNA polymerase sigma factor n=1 Tax=Desertivirga xinjiangensis TaxID=539206 RepID=UPI00210D9F0D
MHDTVSKKDIEELVKGNESAFNKIYDCYGNKVYRLAFRFLKDAEQSEEIVQETFIKLWLNKECLDAGGNMWLYLYVITKRLCLNALRKIHQSADLFEKLLISIKEADNKTEEEILAADMERFTQKVLSSLPKQQQLVFKLSRVDGMSHKEIAEQLHISKNTVKNHLVQALKTIKSKINQTNFIYILPLLLL